MSTISNNLSFIPPEYGQTAEEIEHDVISGYEKVANVTLYPADPVTLYLKSLAYALSVQNAVIDYAAKQTLLAFADGLHLEHIGLLMGVHRHEPTPARTLLQFSIAEKLGYDVVIPKDTRTTTKSGDVVFVCMENGIIPAGSLSCNVLAECSLGNEKAKGLIAGQICEIVDPLAYVTSVRNMEDITSGGELEEDESLRQRIQEAPETFTVAGSVGSYEAQTKNVSSLISDVKATSPTPGIVDVRFILKGGELPNAAMTNQVKNHLSSEDVRPLTDFVQVSAPDVVEYELNCTWYLDQSLATQANAITESVNKAAANYILWQKEKIGRDINPDELTHLLKQAGAKRVEISSPVFTKLQSTQVAKETTVSLIFGGVEVE